MMPKTQLVHKQDANEIYVRTLNIYTGDAHTLRRRRLFPPGESLGSFGARARSTSETVGARHAVPHFNGRRSIDCRAWRPAPGPNLVPH